MTSPKTGSFITAIMMILLCSPASAEKELLCEKAAAMEVDLQRVIKNLKASVESLEAINKIAATDWDEYREQCETATGLNYQLFKVFALAGSSALEFLILKEGIGKSDLIPCLKAWAGESHLRDAESRVEAYRQRQLESMKLLTKVAADKKFLGCGDGSADLQVAPADMTFGGSLAPFRKFLGQNVYVEWTITIYPTKETHRRYSEWWGHSGQPHTRAISDAERRIIKLIGEINSKYGKSDKPYTVETKYEITQSGKVVETRRVKEVVDGSARSTVQ